MHKNLFCSVDNSSYIQCRHTHWGFVPYLNNGKAKRRSRYTRLCTCITGVVLASVYYIQLQVTWLPPKKNPPCTFQQVCLTSTDPKNDHLSYDAFSALM